MHSSCRRSGRDGDRTTGVARVVGVAEIGSSRILLDVVRTRGSGHANMASLKLGVGHVYNA